MAGDAAPGERARGGEPVLAGVGTALVTPFAGDAVDLDALARLVEAQVAGGVAFLVPCGTTGESPTLTDRERTAVIARTVEAAAGRVPVVAGTGTNDTARSVALTQEARRAGAQASLAVAPYYNRPTQEGLYAHFRAMIDEGGLPTLLYHIPARSAVSIDTRTVARVARAGGVLGIKETGSVARVVALRGEAGVRVFSGDDALTLPMIALGGEGVVSVASNVVPRPLVALVDLARAGRVREALALHERLLPLFEALFLEPNPVPVKAALVHAGLLGDARVRLPLVPASPPVREALERALAPLAVAV